MSYFQSFIERMRAFGVKPVNRRKITAQQMYPWAIERQLQDELQTEFRNAGEFYMKEALRGTSSFHDSMDDLDNSTYNNDDVLKPLAARVSRQVEVFQQETFANFTDTVIGARYIPSAVSTEISETWQKNFVTTCKSVEDNLKSRVSQIVNDAVMNGNNISDTAKQIREAVGKMSKSKALTIARTETAKLNMAISKAQMQECGIEYYEWSCMMDERSRASHVKMDGRICIWNDPTKYYDLNSHRLRDRPQSAVHLHPGDDVNCRCIALPWDPLIEEELNKKKGKPNDAWLKMQEEQKQKEAEKRAQREQDKRNRELVPKLEKQVETFEAETKKLQEQVKKLRQEIELQNLEIEGLENTVSDIEGNKQFVVYVTNDEGQKIAFKKTAENMQEAKHAVFLELQKNKNKYGTNPVVHKYSEANYQNKTKKALRIDIPSPAEKKDITENEVQKIIEQKTQETATKLGLTRKSSNPTYADVNPNRDEYRKQGKQGNCQNCVAAIWFSEKGYNAIACPKSKYCKPWNINDIWIDPKTNRNPERTFVRNLRDLEQAALKLPDGGMLQLYHYQPGYNVPGHTLIIQKYNGKAYIRDGQPDNPIFCTFKEYNQIYSSVEAQMEGREDGFRDWLFEKDGDVAQYWRIDNCYPSDAMLDGVIMPSSKK